MPILEAARMWFVVIMTGMGIGIAGAWLDVLVRWLSDIREGRCSYGFFYNEVACCSGLDPGEVCREWQTWSEYFHIRSIFGGSLLQAFIYVALAVCFAGSAAFWFTQILGGYVFDAFLSPWTLFIKALGLALAVASGLSLGKEGPLVHVACCMAYFLMTYLFKGFANNEAQKRKLLAAAAAAGVSVAFGSPLGGVLFGLEELDTFSNESDVMWRGFVASAVAAVSLQWIDPFGTAKLVLFQVTFVDDTWRAFELIPWITLGVIGGVLGSFLIKLNVEIALYRRNSILTGWPVLEVVSFSAFTAAISYLSSELVANLFQECDPNKGDYHGLCNPTALTQNVFLLILTAAVKFFLTAYTFGMMVPAGIFLPTITIGACLGRAVGLLTQALYRAYPTAWIFLSCPPDPSVRCISPGFYAVIGASAMLGGVTRMTISLVVILFELTGALSHVLPIMICVMTSKWVGDALGKDGIYSVWIAMRNYPWLPPVDYHDKGETGANLMRPRLQLVVIDDEVTTINGLDNILNECHYHGFPVVRGNQFVGYAAREKLQLEIEHLLTEDARAERLKKCSFSPEQSMLPWEEKIDLSKTLEDAVLQLRKEVPQELVVNMFQKLSLRQIIFTREGELTGIVTKSDIVELLTRHFPHTGGLKEGH
ncbi:Cl-channel protein [Cyathus striatus]|nr:Cl-channel protein [Cyathus striatus]